MDSPLYAGVNYERVDLSPDASNPVYLDVFADTPAELKMTPEELEAHRNLVKEAAKLFASHHYGHYDFLFSLSDTIGKVKDWSIINRAEDGNAELNSFTAGWRSAGRDLLAHQYLHSWNGKFRRPADLWTANFNVPMIEYLLWVYERADAILRLCVDGAGGIAHAGGDARADRADRREL